MLFFLNDNNRAFGDWEEKNTMKRRNMHIESISWEEDSSLRLPGMLWLPEGSERIWR